MRSRLAALALLLAVGCMQVPSWPPPDKPNPDQPAPAPERPETSVGKADFYRGLVRWLQHGGGKTTDDVLAVAKRARETLGLPAGGDEVSQALGDLLQGNQPLTEERRTQIIDRISTLIP